ncbi:stalk domain-containing protein [Paenibacillus hexagrammi]|uniref:Copper amine oxidase N-terminal domain-containing protein n=1 Tax=Paenibacillus hexagrammi TaxID=2908839 RepID=A0ABY3SMJ5_9BACL|nr:stalk domain-containing protein [Paenibacillus sp. YPD9-1]UJF35219.1 copper amine oxidase N-terminal domain-containing protein [Paenibacillus sp. YPD9-1]
MKVQRIFTLMLVFFGLSTATVVASSIWGNYEGFSIARLSINDETQEFSDSDVPPLIVNGKTMLPLRSLTKSLEAMVKWDNTNKTVSIYKPNVHMIVASSIDNEFNITGPFSVVKKGGSHSFVILAQVDNLSTSISSVRVSIESPSGQEVGTFVPDKKPSGSSFWLPALFNGVSFDEYGNYKVKFEMQLDDSSGYVVVSEKQILSN